MKGSTRVAKGRVEESAGVLTNNDKLRAKGRTDQAAGRVRQAAEKGIRRVRESVRGIAGKDGGRH